VVTVARSRNRTQYGCGSQHCLSAYLFAPTDSFFASVIFAMANSRCLTPKRRGYFYGVVTVARGRNRTQYGCGSQHCLSAYLFALTDSFFASVIFAMANSRCLTPKRRGYFYGVVTTRFCFSPPFTVRRLNILMIMSKGIIVNAVRITAPISLKLIGVVRNRVPP